MGSLDFAVELNPALQSSYSAVRSGNLLRLPYDEIILLQFLLVGTVYFLGRGTLWAKPDPHHFKWFERPQLKDKEGTVVTAKRTRNAAQHLENTGSEIAIFWGSQSGTAEGLAYRLAREVKQRFRKDAQVLDLSDYDPETIALISSSQAVVFILATYGEGEPCDNSWGLLNWLHASIASEAPLSSLRYAAFGLGNSRYRFYNKVVTDTVQLLEGLGATALVSTGKGDEATRSTDEDFMEWEGAFLSALGSFMGLLEQDAEYLPRLEVIREHSVARIKSLVPAPNVRRMIAKASPIVQLAVQGGYDLMSRLASNRKCVHISLDLSAHPQVKYRTGDHIAIWPTNPAEEVSRILHLLHLESSKKELITIRASDNMASLELPSQTTIEELFTNHLDICGPVRRTVVLSMASFVSSEMIKMFLRSIGQDKAAHASCLSQHHITFPRLLQLALDQDPEASWSFLPLSFVIESVSPLAPRTYSISSSSTTSPRTASLTIAVSSTSLHSNPAITIPGLVSTYLGLDPRPTHVFAQIVQSSFKLPFLAETPIIMVAAGTGIAPFRGFIHERARQASTGKRIGHMLLFFGCRHPDVDFLYCDELENLSNGPLKGKLEIRTVFSRVEGEKMYVQHLLQEESDRVMQILLEEEAGFYVCGSAAMAKDVSAVIIARIAEEKRWSAERVEVWRRERKKAKLWHEDVWG